MGFPLELLNIISIRPAFQQVDAPSCLPHAGPAPAPRHRYSEISVYILYAQYNVFSPDVKREGEKIFRPAAASLKWKILFRNGEGDRRGEQVRLGGDGEHSAAGPGEGLRDGQPQAGASVGSARVPPDEAGGVVRAGF